MKINKVQVLPASSYKYSSSHSGLIIAVDPLIEKDRLYQIFGYYLPSKGILPILVIFENKNAEDGFVLLKERSVLLMQDKRLQGTLGSPVGNVISMDERAKEVPAAREVVDVVTPLTVVLFAPTIVLFTPVVIGTLGVLAILEPGLRGPNLFFAKQNMVNNELIEKVVYPGCSQSGFLYLKLEKKEDIDHLEGLILNVKNIRSNEVQSIMFIIK